MILNSIKIYLQIILDAKEPYIQSKNQFEH